MALLPRYCPSVGTFTAMPDLPWKGGVVFTHGMHRSVAPLLLRTGQDARMESKSWPESLV
jgi:hypothetical protein